LFDTLAILAEQEAQCHGLVFVSIASSSSSCCGF